MKIVFGAIAAIGLSYYGGSVDAVSLSQMDSSSLAQLDSSAQASSQAEGIMPGAGTQNSPTINIIDNNRNMSTNSGGGGCASPCGMGSMG